MQQHKINAKCYSDSSKNTGHCLVGIMPILLLNILVFCKPTSRLMCKCYQYFFSVDAVIEESKK